MGVVEERRQREVAEEEKLLVLLQVAAILGVNEKTVRKLVTTGKLRCKKVGRVLRFKRAWVDDYVNNNRER